MSPQLAANLVCPALALAVLVAPLARRSRSPWLEWARAALMVGWVYLLAFLDHRFQWWHSIDLDFSTHGGIALVLAISLGRVERRLRLALGLLFLAYVALMVALRYHSVPDVVTTALAVAPAVLVTGRRRGGSGGRTLDPEKPR